MEVRVKGWGMHYVMPVLRKIAQSYACVCAHPPVLSGGSSFETISTFADKNRKVMLQKKHSITQLNDVKTQAAHNSVPIINHNY